MDESLYIPEKGHIIWMDFNPVHGHEQKGRRPALVISSTLYNQKAGLVLVCPITTVEKRYPFEVKLESVDASINGFVLSDQVRSVDYVARKATFAGEVSAPVLNLVISNIKLLIS